MGPSLAVEIDGPGQQIVRVDACQHDKQVERDKIQRSRPREGAGQESIKKQGGHKKDKGFVPLRDGIVDQSRQGQEKEKECQTKYLRGGALLS